MADLLKCRQSALNHFLIQILFLLPLECRCTYAFLSLCLASSGNRRMCTAGSKRNFKYQRKDEACIHHLPLQRERRDYKISDTRPVAKEGSAFIGRFCQSRRCSSSRIFLEGYF